MPITTIEEFVKELANAAMCPNCETNPYKQPDLCGYLMAYLEVMKDRFGKLPKEKRILLVGEAPGFHGCGKTGIPFTSQDIMVNCAYFKDIFGGKIGTPSFNQPESEDTAKIVWNKFEGKFKDGNSPFLPLMWNAFPLHPHEAGNPESNREPWTKELDYGIKFVEALLDIFDIDKNCVYAVGRVAWESLNKYFGMGWKGNVHYIRHPSHGGAAEFRNGIDNLPL